MIVTLSWGQLQACRQWGTARHKQYLTGNRERTKAGHDVAMPAIGWRTLADRLRSQAYHPSGRRRATHVRREAAPGTMAALQKIEWTLMSLQGHPAVNGLAVEGTSGDVVVAWRDHAHDGWSIYPIDGVEMELLVPVYEKRTFTEFEMPITRWVARMPIGYKLPQVFLDPLDHAGWQADALEEPVLEADSGQVEIGLD